MKDTTSFASALSEWQQALGESHVESNPEALAGAAQNVAGYVRTIPAILYPGSTEEVQEVVKIAGRHEIGLYPISGGRNWGLGSRSPVRDGCVVVDLKRLNRIHEINTTYGYAVIEAGVTLRQLYDALEETGSQWMFNVTGSASHTTVVGNFMDRGVGYFDSRVEEGSGLEVVLGTGEVMHTGYGHFENCTTTHLYRLGVGPSLDHVFTQGNFGIVTRMGFKLQHRPEAQTALLCGVDDNEGLGRLIDVLGSLRRRELIQHVAHIGNRGRAEGAMGPLARSYLLSEGVPDDDQMEEKILEFLVQEKFVGWSAVCGLSGTPRGVKLAQKEIKKALRGTAKVRFLNNDKLVLLERLTRPLAFLPSIRRKRALLPSILELFGLARGIPTDETLTSVFWGVGEKLPKDGDPDPNHSTRCGWLYTLPMVPLDGASAREAADVADQELGSRGFEALVTFNIVDTRIMEGVINIAFDRSVPEQVEAAHEAIRALRQAYLDRGWYPYRLGIGEMEDFVSEDDSFWRVVRDLKMVFDPKHVISPGRYNLV